MCLLHSLGSYIQSMSHESVKISFGEPLLKVDCLTLDLSIAF